MRWQSMLAIYVLFWAFSVFLVLPFGVHTAADAGEVMPGQAESAPHRFRPGRIAVRVTAVATLLFALFQLNYRFGWVTAEMLDWTR
jgi:predicted secreted protein